MLTTTAISYTNGKPHIGHLYEVILADFFARRDKTSLLTGTDEHGKKIEEAAKVYKETPFDFCSKHSILFKSLADSLQVSYDRFIRTTDIDHKTFVTKCIEVSHAKGDIYKSTFEGWYSVREESYVSEKDGLLTDFKDPITGIPYEKVSEETFFFRLSKYKDIIHSQLETIDIQPSSALNHLKERLADLKDICISRSTFSWGIPFPLDSTHVVYVWFDALLNYVTGGVSLGKTRGHHIIGKDILWFHTAIYLGILNSCDLLEVFRPEKITVHGFIVDEKGVKMSKSLGNVIEVDSLLKKYPVEAIRFYLLISSSLTSDFKFSEKDLVSTYNNILLKQFGNLFQRIFTLLQPVENEVNTLLLKTPLSLLPPSSLSNDLTEYCSHVQKLLSTANIFIQDNKPWSLTGEDKVQLLYQALQYLIQSILFLEPIIPVKCKELLSYIGWDGSQLHLVKGKIKAFLPI